MMAKKRVLSWLVAASLALSLLPTAVLAVENQKTAAELEAQVTELDGKVADAKTVITPETPEANPKTEELQSAVETLVGNGEEGDKKVLGVVADAADIADSAKAEAVNEKNETSGQISTANTANAALDGKVGEVETSTKTATDTIAWLDGTEDTDGYLKETRDALDTIVSDAETAVELQKTAIAAQQSLIDEAVTNANNALADANAYRDIAVSETATPAQKEAAAAAAETAASEAATAAANAQLALDAANEAKGLAEVAVETARTEYENAVLAANEKIGEEKQIALAVLEQAKQALNDAEVEQTKAAEAHSAAEAAKNNADAYAQQAAAAAAVAQDAYDAAVLADTALKGKQDELDKQIKATEDTIKKHQTDIETQQGIINENTAKKIAAEAYTPERQSEINGAVDTGRKDLVSKAGGIVDHSHVLAVDLDTANKWAFMTRTERTQWVINNQEALKKTYLMSDRRNELEQQIKIVTDALEAQTTMNNTLAAWNDAAKAALAKATTQKGELEAAKKAAEEKLNGRKDETTGQQLTTGLRGEQTALAGYMTTLAEKITAALQKVNEAQTAQRVANDAKQAAKEAYDNYTAAQKDLEAAKQAVTDAENRLKQNDTLSTEDLEAKLANAKLALAEAESAVTDAAGKKDEADRAAEEAQNAAEEARRAADEAISNLPSTGDTGTTPDTDDDDDTAATIEDGIVPLALMPTRGELMNYLYVRAGSPAAQAPTFTDVPADHEFAAAIGWAQANGIAVAYEDGTFDPDNFVIAADLTAFLTRYADFAGMTMPALTAMAGLEDDAIVENADEILAEFFGG